VGRWSVALPGGFIRGKESRYPFDRRLGGPLGRSGRVRKISPSPVLHPRTSQPIASRYTHYPGPQFPTILCNITSNATYTETRNKNVANMRKESSDPSSNETLCVWTIRPNTTNDQLISMKTGDFVLRESVLKSGCSITSRSKCIKSKRTARKLLIKLEVQNLAHLTVCSQMQMRRNQHMADLHPWEKIHRTHPRRAQCENGNMNERENIVLIWKYGSPLISSDFKFCTLCYNSADHD
jgi:hypothetical protein